MAIVRHPALAKKVPKPSVIRQRQTRIEILKLISDNTGLKRSEVETVFDELKRIVDAHLKKQGSGEITIPKLGLKLRRIRRKPTKKRVMVSPLTGQEVTILPKPARDDVKPVVMKALRDVLV